MVIIMKTFNIAEFKAQLAREDWLFTDRVEDIMFGTDENKEVYGRGQRVAILDDLVIVFNEQYSYIEGHPETFKLLNFKCFEYQRWDFLTFNVIDDDGCVFLEEELEEEMEEFPKFSDVKYDKDIRS